MPANLRTIGLIVRQGAFQGRSGRDQLDIALSAATLGISLELYFTARGLLQLLPPPVETGRALPGGVKGWKSLPGLTSVQAWSTPDALEAIPESASRLLLEVRAAPGAEISARLAKCDRVLVL